MGGGPGAKRVAPRPPVVEPAPPEEAAARAGALLSLELMGELGVAEGDGAAAGRLLSESGGGGRRSDKKEAAPKQALSKTQLRKQRRVEVSTPTPIHGSAAPLAPWSRTAAI